MAVGYGKEKSQGFPFIIKQYIHLLYSILFVSTADNRVVVDEIPQFSTQQEKVCLHPPCVGNNYTA